MQAIVKIVETSLESHVTEYRAELSPHCSVMFKVTETIRDGEAASICSMHIKTRNGAGWDTITLAGIDTIIDAASAAASALASQKRKREEAKEKGE